MSENWVNITAAENCPKGMSVNSIVNGDQVAILHYDTDEWYAVQNLCPHQEQMVLSRGLCGDLEGEPKVACPLHKHNFSLKTGCHLADDSQWELKTYEIKIKDNCIFIKT